MNEQIKIGYAIRLYKDGYSIEEIKELIGGFPFGDVLLLQ